MKKQFKLILLFFMIIGLSVGCDNKDVTNAKDGKLGVASSQRVSKTAKENEIEFETVVVGVAIIEDKIAYIDIDVSQQFAAIKDDEIVMEVLATKKQQGYDYGLLEASKQTGLSKEWADQIADVEYGLISKTISEAKAYFVGDEILSAASIDLSTIEKTTIKALKSAVAIENISNVGLGYHVSLIEKANTVYSTLDYAMVATNYQGKIIKVLLDSAEEKAKYEKDNWELINVNQSKMEQKADYGMLAQSEINLEWYQQNQNLMEYLEGMDILEIATISEDEELKSSVTFNINPLNLALAHAKENLKDLIKWYFYLNTLD